MLRSGAVLSSLETDFRGSERLLIGSMLARRSIDGFETVWEVYLHFQWLRVRAGLRFASVGQIVRAAR